MENSSFSDISSDEELLQSQSKHLETDLTLTSIIKPSEFLEQSEKNKKVKVFKEISPLNQTYQLIDISLHKKGPREDKFYSLHPFYIKNYERGKCFLQLYNNSEEIPHTQILIKRGFQKFFDLEPKYIICNKQPEIKLLYGEGLYYDRIFENIKNFFEKRVENEFLTIYKIYKENGEHCQISYVKIIDCWVIGSKNVTMLLRTKEDLDLYKKERHMWTIIIAEEWLNILNCLTKEEIQNLKEIMDGKTFLAEHCGHKDHKHILTYDKIQIYFYAIINNNKNNICYDPQFSYNIFKKFKLNNSKINKIENIKSFDCLIDELIKLDKKVVGANIDSEGEGSVIYFCGFLKDKKKGKVLSMCKLKTVEYWIFRNLREHLKKYINKGFDNTRRIEKLENEIDREIKKHCVLNNPPNSISFYKNLIRISFDYVKNNQEEIKFNDMYYNFTEFLKKMIDIIKKNDDNKIIDPKNQLKYDNFVDNLEITNRKIQLILITPPFYLKPSEINFLCNNLKISEILTNWREEQNFKENEYIKLVNLHIIPKLSGKNFSEFTYFIIAGFNEKSLKNTIKNIENLTENEKKNLSPGEFTFVKSKNLEVQIQLLKKNIDNLLVFLKKEYSLNFEIYENNEENLEFKTELLEKIIKIMKINKKIEIKNEENNEFDRNLIVIVPLGIPGMGKSNLTTILSEISTEINFNYYSISSDIIRKEEMEIYSKEKSIPNSEFGKLYNQTLKSSNRKYFINLKTILKKIEKNELDKNKNFLLFLDKNHTPNILNTNIDFLRENCPSNTNMKIIGLIPLCNNNYKCGENLCYEYPFSATFFLVCLNRCINRDNHETLIGDAHYYFKVLLKFFQIFRNFKIKSSTLHNFGFDDFFYLPMHFENEKENISSGLLNLFEKCLDGINPGYEPDDLSVIMDFIKEFFKVKFTHPEIDIQIIKEKLKINLNILFEKI